MLKDNKDSQLKTKAQKYSFVKPIMEEKETGTFKDVRSQLGPRSVDFGSRSRRGPDHLLSSSFRAETQKNS